MVGVHGVLVWPLSKAQPKKAMDLGHSNLYLFGSCFDAHPTMPGRFVLAERCSQGFGVAHKVQSKLHHPSTCYVKIGGAEQRPPNNSTATLTARAPRAQVRTMYSQSTASP